jgi:hypothetical protein
MLCQESGKNSLMDVISRKRFNALQMENVELVRCGIETHLRSSRLKSPDEMTYHMQNITNIVNKVNIHPSSYLTVLTIFWISRIPFNLSR